MGFRNTSSIVCKSRYGIPENVFHIEMTLVAEATEV